jgi:alcohol dehydrogenase
VVYKEISLRGVFSHDFKAVEPAIRMAARGKYPLADMITHRFPLEDALKAVKLVGGEFPEENPMKVVLDPALSG